VTFAVLICFAAIVDSLVNWTRGGAAGGQGNPAEDAPEAHAAAVPVREDRNYGVRGERVRLRGQERVAGIRPGGVDRVQRGPLAAEHTAGRGGRHVQLSVRCSTNATTTSATRRTCRTSRGTPSLCPSRASRRTATRTNTTGLRNYYHPARAASVSAAVTRHPMSGQTWAAA